MSFDSVADRLYGLPPGQFVAERTAAEKQARSSGERELATRLKSLAKPTTVGWLANQLVREHPEEIGPLLELGTGLRAATASLRRDELQELMRLQHQVIAGLIKQARAIARNAGQRISEDVVRGLEDTLRAALADESLGRQLLAAQLTGPLEHNGFPGVTTSAGAPIQRKSVTKAPEPDDRLAGAEQAVTEARAELQDAEHALNEAQNTLAKAESATGELQERLQQLQAELDTLSHEADDAEETEHAARTDADRRNGEAEKARRRLEAALAKRDEIAS